MEELDNRLCTQVAGGGLVVYDDAFHTDGLATSWDIRWDYPAEIVPT